MVILSLCPNIFFYFGIFFVFSDFFYITLLIVMKQWVSKTILKHYYLWWQVPQFDHTFVIFFKFYLIFVVLSSLKFFISRRLSHLRLGKNSLSAITADWPAPLPSLITLDISQNLIIRLSLTSLSLRKLDLSDNMLSSLPLSSNLSQEGLTNRINPVAKGVAPAIVLPPYYGATLE